MRVLFFTCLDEIAPSSLAEPVRSAKLLFSAHVVWPECIVHSSEVDIRLALLQVGLIAALRRIKLDLMLMLALPLWLLRFLNHQLHVTLGKLLGKLSLR